MDLQIVRNSEGLFDVIDKDRGGMLVDTDFKTREDADTWIKWTFEVDDSALFGSTNLPE